MKLSILIGGAAGQGVNTTEQLLLSTLSKYGIYHHSSKEYMSRVRGGLNFTQLTLSDEPIQVHYDFVDLLVAFTPEAGQEGLKHLSPNGCLLCDENAIPTGLSTQTLISLPYQQLLKEAEHPKGLSMLIYGALAKLLSLSDQALHQMQSKKWSPIDLEKNKKIAQLAYQGTESVFTLPFAPHKGMISITGNHSVALGAAAAGLSFYSAYPMAPSTSVMNYLSRYERQQEIIIEQVEDEIAAINAAIGASAVGSRAMTASSGGGFSLMVEALGFAAVAEIPLVVLDVQRPGPATGMATKTEQSDLNFILNASQGEFPRFVLSYKNIEDCFYQTFRAFNLADHYRVPVLLLSDQYLADAATTVPAFKLEDLHIHRNFYTAPLADYRHHDLEDPYAGRLCPGMTDELVMYDSHEHDEQARVTESAQNRIMMNQRRMSKLEDMVEDMLEPEQFGSDHADYLFISWGSVTSFAEEAAKQLREEGYIVSCLSFNDLYPLPQNKLKQWFSTDAQVINVEGNYQGQLAQLIARETGHLIEDSILKFDGRQFTPDYIVAAFKELVHYE